jgi:hypothetical protein
MRNAVLTLAALLAAASAQPAMAQAAVDQQDARCLMVLQVISRDPKQAEQAAKGVYFYLGRISARGSIARLENIMFAEAAKMNPQEAQADLQRCSQELNARTQEYQGVNQRIAARIKPAVAPAKK